MNMHLRSPGGVHFQLHPPNEFLHFQFLNKVYNKNFKKNVILY